MAGTIAQKWFTTSSGRAIKMVNEFTHTLNIYVLIR